MEETKATTRRKFLKYLGAGLGGIGLGALIGSKLTLPVQATAPPSTTVQPDVISTDLFTGPPGTQTITYNADGTVASYTYANLTVTYTYNSDGTMATCVRTITNGPTITDTFTYNTALGTVASMVRA